MASWVFPGEPKKGGNKDRKLYGDSPFAPSGQSPEVSSGKIMERMQSHWWDEGVLTAHCPSQPHDSMSLTVTLAHGPVDSHLFDQPAGVCVCVGDLLFPYIFFDLSNPVLSAQFHKGSTPFYNRNLPISQELL